MAVVNYAQLPKLGQPHHHLVTQAGDEVAHILGGVDVFKRRNLDGGLIPRLGDLLPNKRRSPPGAVGKLRSPLPLGLLAAREHRRVAPLGHGDVDFSRGIEQIIMVQLAAQTARLGADQRVDAGVETLAQAEDIHGEIIRFNAPALAA